MAKKKQDSQTDSPKITRETVSQAEKVAGLAFTESETELMLEGVIERLGDYVKLREVQLENSVPPALHFGVDPLLWRVERGRLSLCVGGFKINRRTVAQR